MGSITIKKAVVIVAVVLLVGYGWKKIKSGV